MDWATSQNPLRKRGEESWVFSKKIPYFRTTPQQADGAFARKLVGQSTDYHEF